MTDQMDRTIAAAPVPMHGLTEAIHLGEDELPHVDLGDGSTLQVLQVDLNVGLWIVRTRFQPGYQVAKHYHTGQVFAVTLAGSWYYLEYPDQKQTAGSYLYEPGGSVHTFHTPEDNEDVTDGFMVVAGCNINFDADGNYVNTMDAGWIEQAILEAAKAQGLETPRYIKPKRGAGFSDED